MWINVSQLSFCSHVQPWVMSLHLCGWDRSGPNSPNLTVKPDYYIISVGKIRLSGSRHGKSTLFICFFGHLPFQVWGWKLTHTLFILVKQVTCFIRLCSTFASPERFCFFSWASTSDLTGAPVRWGLPFHSLSTGSLIKSWHMWLIWLEGHSFA